MGHQRYTLPTTPDRVDELAAGLIAAGALGLWEREAGHGLELIAWFPDRCTAVPAGGWWAEEPARDWLVDWKAGLEPITVGALVVAPSWRAEGLPAGPGRIVLDPGMAFGTGHHPTTRLCLAGLQRLDLSGARVLDVGSGSGILAIAAARLGASAVVAVDTDPDAVAAARANAARNRVAVDVRPGSLTAVDGHFDVVVANLTTAVVLELAADLVALTAGGGWLICSGVAAPRAARVVAAVRRLGAAQVELMSDSGWVALTARCHSAPPRSMGRRAASLRGGPATYTRALLSGGSWWPG